MIDDTNHPRTETAADALRRAIQSFEGLVALRREDLADAEASHTRLVSEGMTGEDLAAFDLAVEQARAGLHNALEAKADLVVRLAAMEV